MHSRQTEAVLSIDNAALRVQLDGGRGTFHCATADGRTVFSHATTGVRRPGSILTADRPGAARSAIKRPAHGFLGSADELVLRFADDGIETEAYLRLYPGGPAIIEMGMTVRNATDRPMTLLEAYPFCIHRDQAGAFYLKGNPADWKILTNGYTFADPGELTDLRRPNPSESWYLDTRWDLRELHSAWWATICDPESRLSAVIGSMNLPRYQTNVSLAYPARRQRNAPQRGFAATLRVCDRDRFELEPGAARHYDGVVLYLADDPFAALEGFADLAASFLRIPPQKPVPVGWCHWFYTLTHITEEEVLRNADFIAQHLKDYGVKLIQVDDGYQRDLGDWRANDSFPGGMKHLAAEIRRRGLVPGIWMAPWSVNPGSPIHHEHPDWLVQTPEGGVEHNVRVGRCILDPTRPEARAWLKAHFQELADWGYEFFKTDFVYQTLAATDNYHDRTVSRAQAHQLSLRAIREAIGPDRHLLDCGPPCGASQIDSWRIESDTERLSWWQYRYETARGVARRYFLNRRLWTNDPDHLGIAHLNQHQAQAAATLIAMSGGTVMLGDRLYGLSPQELELLKKVLPPTGETARPLDLFEKQIPENYLLAVNRPWERWHVLALFNWSDQPREAWFDFSHLGDAAAERFVFEFWSQQFLGLRSGGLGITVPGESVRLLAIRPALARPQLIGTNRHVLQGAVELEEITWNEQSATLRGRSLGVRGTAQRLTLHLPPGWSPDEDRLAGIARHHRSGNLMHLDILFPDAAVSWEVGFARPAAG